jgi:hypothetical protein
MKRSTPRPSARHARLRSALLVCSAALAVTLAGVAQAQCPGTLVTNPDFAAGLTDWPTLTQSPQLAVNGCNATNSLQMWGNHEVGESVKQALPGGGLIAGHTYRVTVSYRWLDINPTAPAYVRVRLAAFAAQPTAYPPDGGYAWSDVTPDTTSTTSCNTYTFPDFLATTTLPWLTINPENASTVNDGGLVSWAQIDDNCIEDVPPPPPHCEFNNCKAKQIKTSMVRAFTACGEPGGNSPNATTETGIPSCAPPVPLSAYNFKPPCGGSCSVQIKAAKKVCGTAGTPCCCITINSKCSGVLGPDTLPANGPFSLFARLRVTGNDALGGDMTLIDTPFNRTMNFTSGKAYYKSGCIDLPVDAVIPTCSSVEFVDLAIIDPDGDRFAVPGVSCCGQ